MPRLLRRSAQLAKCRITVNITAGTPKDTARLYREVLRRGLGKSADTGPSPRARPEAEALTFKQPISDLTSPSPVLTSRDASLNRSIEAIQKALGGYQFRNPTLCLEALFFKGARVAEDHAVIGDGIIRSQLGHAWYRWLLKRYGYSPLDDSAKVLKRFMHSFWQSNSHWALIWKQHFQSSEILLPGGTSNVRDTSTALEALIGVVYEESGDRDTEAVLQHLGLLFDYEDAAVFGRIKQQAHRFNQRGDELEQKPLLKGAVESKRLSQPIKSEDSNIAVTTEELAEEPRSTLEDAYVVDVEDDGAGSPRLIGTTFNGDRGAISFLDAPCFISVTTGGGIILPSDLISAFQHLPGLKDVWQRRESKSRWWMRFVTPHAAVSAISTVDKATVDGVMMQARLEYRDPPRTRVRMMDQPDQKDLRALKYRNLDGLRRTYLTTERDYTDMYYEFYTRRQAITAAAALKQAQLKVSNIVHVMPPIMTSQPERWICFPVQETDVEQQQSSAPQHASSQIRHALDNRDYESSIEEEDEESNVIDEDDLSDVDDSDSAVRDQLPSAEGFSSPLDLSNLVSQQDDKLIENTYASFGTFSADSQPGRVLQPSVSSSLQDTSPGEYGQSLKPDLQQTAFETSGQKRNDTQWQQTRLEDGAEDFQEDLVNPNMTKAQRASSVTKRRRIRAIPSVWLRKTESTLSLSRRIEGDPQNAKLEVSRKKRASAKPISAATHKSPGNTNVLASVLTNLSIARSDGNDGSIDAQPGHRNAETREVAGKGIRYKPFKLSPLGSDELQKHYQKKVASR